MRSSNRQIAASVQKDGLVAASVQVLKPFSILLVFFFGVSLLQWMPEGAYVLTIAIAMALAFFKLPRDNHRIFMLYVLGFMLFNGMRVFADDTIVPTSFTYAAGIDGVFGTNPGSWLQARFYTPGTLGVLGWAALATYSSYFLTHYVLSLIIWRVRPQVLPVFVMSILATLFIGLTIYYLLPTAPPWLASEHGTISSVVRIAAVERSDLWADAYHRGTYIAGMNDVAAMPSLHTALTMVIALTLFRLNRALGIMGLIYVAFMGFSLVYLGEHYVVDVVAGALVAAAGVFAVNRAMALSARRHLQKVVGMRHSDPRLSDEFALGSPGLRKTA